MNHSSCGRNHEVLHVLRWSFTSFLYRRRCHILHLSKALLTQIIQNLVLIHEVITIQLHRIRIHVCIATTRGTFQQNATFRGIFLGPGCNVHSSFLPHDINNFTPSDFGFQQMGENLWHKAIAWSIYMEE